jgi:hypothetical protein
MIYMRIICWIEKSEILRNTIWISAKQGLHTHNLAILMTEIIKASEEGNTVSALFLDIKSAYDNVHAAL